MLTVKVGYLATGMAFLFVGAVTMGLIDETGRKITPRLEGASARRALFIFGCQAADRGKRAA